MTEIYTKSILNYSTSIEPSKVNKNIDKTLEDRIRKEMEGKCINDGYIKKGSVKIVSRGMGKILVSQFNGAVVFNVRYAADILNPLEGMIVSGKVININKMGVLCEGGEDDPAPLSILMAKQHHVDNVDFEKLKVNDVIKIKILGKRFEYGDNQINIIGVLDNSSESEIVEGDIVYSSRSKDYGWLSAFNKGNPFTYKDRMFDTVEHAFHAQKSDDETYKDALTKTSENYIGDKPNNAKKFGGKKNFEALEIELVEDWDDIRLEEMYNITLAYYESNPELKEKLLETGNSKLVHKGWRIDTFWGVNTHGNGENNHGNTLMNLRDLFSKQ